MTDELECNETNRVLKKLGIKRKDLLKRIEENSIK